MTFGAPAPAPPTDALLPAEPERRAGRRVRDVHRAARAAAAADRRVETAEPASPSPSRSPSREPEPEPRRIAATVAPSVPRDRTEPSPERRNLLPFAIAAGVVIAAVLGFVIGGSGGGSEPTSTLPAVPKSNAAMKLKVPETWTDAAAPKVPGAHARRRQGGRGRRRDRAVRDRPRGREQLDVAADRRAAGRRRGPEEPRGGEDRARRGRGLPLSRPRRSHGLDQPVTLYAIPTPQGVATVACVPSAASCDGVANTLELNGKPFPVGPSEDYAKKVSGVLGALNAKVAKASGGARQGQDARRSGQGHRRPAGRLPQGGGRPPRGAAEPRGPGRQRAARRRARRGGQGVRAGRRGRQGQQQGGLQEGWSCRNDSATRAGGCIGRAPRGRIPGPVLRSDMQPRTILISVGVAVVAFAAAFGIGKATSGSDASTTGGTGATATAFEQPIRDRQRRGAEGGAAVSSSRSRRPSRRPRPRRRRPPSGDRRRTPPVTGGGESPVQAAARRP